MQLFYIVLLWTPLTAAIRVPAWIYIPAGMSVEHRTRAAEEVLLGSQIAIPSLGLPFF